MQLVDLLHGRVTALDVAKHDLAGLREAVADPQLVGFEHPAKEAREEDRLVEVAPFHTRRSLGPRQDALEHPDTVLICVQLEATTDEKAIGVKRDPLDPSIDQKALIYQRLFSHPRTIPRELPSLGQRF